MSKSILSKNFSVVIPTADRDNLLKKAVESALNQTAAPAKVIVVDNGKTPR